MDTIIIIRDSVATCANSLSEECQPIVKVAETNCADVEIVKIICITIAIVSVCLVILSLIWHYINVSATKKKEKTDFEKTIELLNNVVDKVTAKEGKLDIDKVNNLLDIYNKVKNDFANEENNNEN